MTAARRLQKGCLLVLSVRLMPQMPLPDKAFAMSYVRLTMEVLAPAAIDTSDSADDRQQSK